jgi:hypothetical protein
MKQTDAIYPMVETLIKKTSLIFKTNLRKEYNGVWYLIFFYKCYELSNHKSFDKEEIAKLTNDFHKLVYIDNFLLIIDLNHNHHDGTPMCLKDKDQTPEVERLKKILFFL